MAAPKKSYRIKGCGCDCANMPADPCEPCGGQIGIASLCRSRSGAVSLCGYEEYTSPSVPPKKYLKKTFSGKNTVKKYAGPGCAGALETGTCIVSPTGSNRYEPSASGCGSEIVGGSAVVEAGGPPSSVPITSITNLFCAIGANCGSNVSSSTKTKLSIQATLVGGGTGCSGSCEAQGDSMTETLSQEDTDQNAISRSSAVWTEYAASDYCCSGIEPRTSGFAVVFQEAQMRLIVTGPKGGLANIDVPFSRASYGDTPTHESWVDTFPVAFGDAGEAQIDVSIPNTRGYTTCAGPARLSKDQPAT